MKEFLVKIKTLKKYLKINEISLSISDLLKINLNNNIFFLLFSNLKLPYFKSINKYFRENLIV